jgi:hypothetical protein
MAGSLENSEPQTGLPLYKLEDLVMRPKRPRRHVSACRRMVRPTASHLKESWGMDFMSAELYNGQRIKPLTLLRRRIQLRGTAIEY